MADYPIYPEAGEALCQELGISRSLSQKERDKIADEDFAGPHHSFPIDSQEHLESAARLIGHADDPAAVKSKAIAIAKRKGFTLPDSWKEDSDRTEAPEEVRVDIDSSGNHAEMSGTHAHHHQAYGDQGGDEGHNHSHSHDGDNNHHHSHAAVGAEKDTEKAAVPDLVRGMPSEPLLFGPILRIDRGKREVVVRATVEDLDTYGTVIGFDGSKEAFTQWRGNIREMHDSSKAVGKALKWEPIDEERAIDLTLRVSPGAEDTWQKVLDGTLSGASIGARNAKWGKKQWKGKEVPFLERYDLVEVSLVDNPSCPGCDIKVVRMDGADSTNFLATDVLDFSEDAETPPPPAPDAEIERRGARVATNTMGSMHKSRDHALQGVREMLSNCSCDECQCALHTLDPDGDGDVDIVSSLDTDRDHAGGAGNAMGAAAGDGSGIMKSVEAEITRHLAPIVQRMQAIAARLSLTSTPPPPEEHETEVVQRLNALANFTTNAQPDMTRRLDQLEQKLSELDEVRSVLAEVKGLVARIAAQPTSGGPIVNSAAMRMAENEVPYGQPDIVAVEAEIIARLAKSGILSKDQQVNAALHLQKQAAARR